MYFYVKSSIYLIKNNIYQKHCELRLFEEQEKSSKFKKEIIIINKEKKSENIQENYYQIIYRYYVIKCIYFMSEVSPGCLRS